MVNFTFRGLMAPTLTAFKNDWTVDLSVIQDYAKFLADSKIMGVLVNGTSGEGMSLNVRERKQVAEEWVKAVKKTNQHLMVQVGGAPLPDVLELAKHAESIGVHSLLCLPDLYNKPANSADLIRYLKTVGAAAPNTPLLYYHIPSYTNVNIHMGQFLNDSVGKIPTFHGIKFTSTALDEGVAAVEANGGKYAVFLGADQLMAGAFTLGFDSAIATSLNMFPQLGVKILDAVKQSKLNSARETQQLLTKVCSVVTKHGPWVPTMKVAMDLFTPIKVGKAREPLTNITPEQVKEMGATMKTINYC
ncbi:N-acetylneuraminate lyase isoform X2 [Tribolium castaneum]|uniref:N-acetylneuraminate lyase n=1 Tax=Tribolium castaneum TaxID=7070 RepID=D6WME9_TRICA|nr:PREDICTED: N-acetylneuraminate lyase isoform X1 [Tribolium castaneum]XP_015835954.1 PREDICTED: N-acetylneuraminate lyase isoform X2 [Tribolium castaneum]EFA04261.2 N-acetylneuraminate lyase-like Protein [Tribolium castaneum]|eukprot:XP_001813448.1 PREDICTED: N-acetylneuraminate lyase isoform X1 [Tribolium castaneum]